MSERKMGFGRRAARSAAAVATAVVVLALPAALHAQAGPGMYGQPLTLYDSLTRALERGDVATARNLMFRYPDASQRIVDRLPDLNGTAAKTAYAATSSSTCRRTA